MSDEHPTKPSLPAQPLEALSFKTVPGPPQAVEGSLPSRDADAEKEAIKIASGTLDDDAKAQEHARTQALRNNVHRAAIAAVWVIFSLFVVCILILAWHELLPTSWAWLSTEQLNAVRTFVFSGALTTAASGYVKQRLS